MFCNAGLAPLEFFNKIEALRPLFYPIDEVKFFADSMSDSDKDGEENFIKKYGEASPIIKGRLPDKIMTELLIV